MSGQEIAACLLGVAALAYLGLRLLRRRAGTCCGERECPAAREVSRRLGRARREAQEAARD